MTPFPFCQSSLPVLASRILPRPILAALIALGGLLAGSGVAWADESIPIFVSGKDRPYEILAQNESRLITVRGPGELRLVSRARFRPADEDGIRYSLIIRINGGQEQEVVYENVGRSRTAMFRDGTLGTPGRLMDYRIQLGRGFHNIEVRTGPDSPQVFFRHLFDSKKAKSKQWVPITPLRDPELVELVSRESVVPYYRNAPQEPFELEIIGPTDLRVFTRIENTPEMRGRIHYRIQVKRDGEVVNTFQLSSRRSEVTVYRKDDSLVPGRAAEVVIPIPEGRHSMQIQPLDKDKSTLLARFMLPLSDLGLTAD